MKEAIHVLWVITALLEPLWHFPVLLELMRRSLARHLKMSVTHAPLGRMLPMPGPLVALPVLPVLGLMWVQLYVHV